MSKRKKTTRREEMCRHAFIENNKYQDIEAAVADLNWMYIDKKGHRHRWVKRGGKDTTPTLREKIRKVPVDDEPGETFDVPYLVCRKCGEEIRPATVRRTAKILLHREIRGWFDSPLPAAAKLECGEEFDLATFLPQYRAKAAVMKTLFNSSPFGRGGITHVEFMILNPNDVGFPREEPPTAHKRKSKKTS
jgi:hypothetical protein